MRNIKFCKNTLKISIHAPREGSDGGPERGPGRAQAISIHAPREGSDVENTGTEQAAVLFLSTLPARGATVQERLCQHHDYISIHAPREGSDARLGGLFPYGRYFYPRSPRGERHCDRQSLSSTSSFLSTLPARGATAAVRAKALESTEFLSTLPARGATCPSGSRASSKIYFYPRSPRGERRWPRGTLTMVQHFYPRSPRGERQDAPSGQSGPAAFLSTLPARGATVTTNGSISGDYISIHAPREGSDLSS